MASLESFYVVTMSYDGQYKRSPAVQYMAGGSTSKNPAICISRNRNRFMMMTMVVVVGVVAMGMVGIIVVLGVIGVADQDQDKACGTFWLIII